MQQRYVVASTAHSFSPLAAREASFSVCHGMKSRTPNSNPILYFLCQRCVLMWTHISASVVSAKKKTHFELFCVPIFPLSSKHVWACAICQWTVPTQQGYVITTFTTPRPPRAHVSLFGIRSFVASYRWEPPFPGHQGPPPGQWQGQPPGQFQQGYNPNYPPPLPQGHPPDK
jgi:hypothetical protein